MAEKTLNTLSLTGVGIGGIIGAGFFLGSGLAIHQAGPSVILAFVLGGLIMTQVLGAIISIHVNRLAPGSFRVYSEQFLGPYVGFLIGWVIFSSCILAMVAEALAMGVFVKYWLPHIPLSVLATVFVLIVIGLNSMGIGAIGHIESFMAGLKILVLTLFIVLGSYMIVGHGALVHPTPFSSFKSFFPEGISGLLQSLLIVIFSFAGISAMALAASEVGDPKREIPKAAAYISFGTILLYSISMLVLVSILPWTKVSVTNSPFVQAFDILHIKWAAFAVNMVILISAFSVITATYFTATKMLVSLAKADKAPLFLTKVLKNGLDFNAWLTVGIASLLLVALSFIVPTKLFHYLISASSYFTFLNWSVNLITYLTWTKHRTKEETFKSSLVFGQPGAVITIGVIALLIVMSLRVAEFRTGFYAAVSIILLISVSYKLLSIWQSHPVLLKRRDEAGTRSVKRRNRK